MPALPIPRPFTKIHDKYNPKDKLFAVIEFNHTKTLHLRNAEDDVPPDVIRCGPNSGIPFSVSHSVDNWLRGMCKRVVHDYHPVDSDVQKDFIKFAHHYIKFHISPLAENLNEDCLLEDWLSHSKYNSARKDKFRELNHRMRIHDISSKQYLALTSFIKSEFYTEPKEARIINSRSDAFKSRVGPYVHAAESIVYDDHFIKHCKPSEVVRKMHEKSADFELFYETDYSSFEGSFSPELLRGVELHLLQRLFANYPEIVSLCAQALACKNKACYRKRYIAEFYGSRMSGEMWTSMCNGYMNKLLVEFVAKRSDAHVDYLVEGDDGFICSNKPLDWSLVEKCGFKLKCEQVENVNDVSFCSLRACGDLLVPDIPRTLSHYGYIIDACLSNALPHNSKRTIKRLDEIQYAKANSLLATSAGIPILQELALQQLRVLSGTHLNPLYFDWWEREFYDLNDPKAKVISPEVRSYVMKEFHIDVATQLEIESAIRKCPYRCYDILLPAR